MKIKSVEKKKLTLLVELTGKDIIEILKASGKIPASYDFIETQVIFNVPSGGDYSGTAITIDEECLIYVTLIREWETK